jgi:hypothetical protein
MSFTPAPAATAKVADGDYESKQGGCRFLGGVSDSPVGEQGADEKKGHASADGQAEEVPPQTG